MALNKLESRKRIKMRIRKIISGTQEKPRMSVFRSNKQISVQIINDAEGKTILSASSLNKSIAEKTGINKIEQASLVGKLIAENAIKNGITTVVFDRNGYLYHGRVKKMVEAARKAGLKI